MTGVIQSKSDFLAGMAFGAIGLFFVSLVGYAIWDNGHKTAVRHSVPVACEMVQDSVLPRPKVKVVP